MTRSKKSDFSEKATSKNLINPEEKTEARRKELLSVFESIDPGQLHLIERLIDEVVYLEDRMAALKQLPMIEVHPRRPELQRSTAASRQYKECASQYMNGVRILCSVLSKTEPTAAEELMRRLEEFT